MILEPLEDEDLASGVRVGDDSSKVLEGSGSSAACALNGGRDESIWNPKYEMSRGVSPDQS